MGNMDLPNNRNALQRGFTLVELMIVVVIVAVLAGIALPAYQDSVRKANRSKAQSYLMEVAQRQQLYFNDSRSYATKVQLGFDDVGDSAVKAKWARVISNYDITFSPLPGPPPTFSITLVPKGQQSGDGTLVIDQAGTKTRDGAAW
ncbi:type IV pilin protein [Candidatus Seongchinamella marina]|jgi:type IV pilus assembly protein PilE|nr:type IV pilin protein [Candidatus Seongchinamella marina]